MFDEKDNKEKYVALRITKAEYERLKAISDDKKINLSKTIRYLIGAGLQQQEQQQPHPV